MTGEPVQHPTKERPGLAAAILLGLGLGGFFDGIVLHQILQWHHMVSARLPADTVPSLQMNTLADGLFHAATYVLVAAGVFLMRRGAQTAGAPVSRNVLPGGLLAGFGAFNLVEGTINHHLLGLHHVNETVVPEHWLWWDLGFLTRGAAMLIGGVVILRSRPLRTR